MAILGKTISSSYLGLSEAERDDLYDTFEIISSIIREVIEDNRELVDDGYEVHGDREHDVIVNLALMWPDSLAIIDSEDFILQPDNYDEELYPLIDDRDLARRTLEAYVIRNRPDPQAQFEAKATRLVNRSHQAQQRNDVPADIKQLLTSQATLLSSLVSRFSYLLREDREDW